MTTNFDIILTYVCDILSQLLRKKEAYSQIGDTSYFNLPESY